MRALNIQPQCAMAIYAHPDDADVAAGGLLAQWAQDGCAVHLVVVCDGDKGSHVLSADAGAVREVRGAEVEFAADLLGAATVTKLERPDGEVENDVELRAELVGLIRQYRPEVVVGPDPTATFFAGVYVNHRDHRETGWALLDAVAPRPRCRSISPIEANHTRSPVSYSVARTNPTSWPTSPPRSTPR